MVLTSALCYLIECVKYHFTRFLVDGHWESWQPWATCSVSCGNGTHVRARACTFVADSPRGEDCPGTANETEPCTDGLCPGNKLSISFERESEFGHLKKSSVHVICLTTFLLCLCCVVQIQ